MLVLCINAIRLTILSVLYLISVPWHVCVSVCVCVCVCVCLCECLLFLKEVLS